MNDKTANIYHGYFIVTSYTNVTADDVNAYYFTNVGTTQVKVAGENVFPNQTLTFDSNNDASLDRSVYEIAFVFPNNPNNRVLVRTRKVKFN